MRKSDREYRERKAEFIERARRGEFVLAVGFRRNGTAHVLVRNGEFTPAPADREWLNRRFNDVRKLLFG